MTRPRCYLCTGERQKRIFALEGPRAVWRCRECGLIGVYPQPTYADVVERYEPKVFAGCEDELEQPTNELKKRRFQFALETLGKRFGKAGARLLDFGCGMGSFMKLAAAGGFEVQGIDISEHAVAYVRERLGFPAVSGRLAESGLARGQFDVITLWDVLHVLSDPVGTLRELRAYLKPDGVIVIKVINADGFIFRVIRGAAAGSLGLVGFPMRLTFRFTVFHFSPRTIAAALRRGGFECGLVYTESHKDFRTFGSKSWGSRAVVRMAARAAYGLGRALGMEEELVAYGQPREGG